MRIQILRQGHGRALFVEEAPQAVVLARLEGLAPARLPHRLGERVLGHRQGDAGPRAADGGDAAGFVLFAVAEPDLGVAGCGEGAVVVVMMGLEGCRVGVRRRMGGERAQSLEGWRQKERWHVSSVEVSCPAQPENRVGGHGVEWRWLVAVAVDVDN
jgi:hypothetical protein